MYAYAESNKHELEDKHKSHVQKSVWDTSLNGSKSYCQIFRCKCTTVLKMCFQATNLCIPIKLYTKLFIISRFSVPLTARLLYYFIHDKIACIYP